MHAKHAAQTRYFRRTWPQLDVERWPGRELHWCWCHPLFTILVVPPVVIVDVAALGHLIGRFS